MAFAVSGMLIAGIAFHVRPQGTGESPDAAWIQLCRRKLSLFEGCGWNTRAIIIEGFKGKPEQWIFTQNQVNSACRPALL